MVYSTYYTLIRAELTQLTQSMANKLNSSSEDAFTLKGPGLCRLRQGPNQTIRGSPVIVPHRGSGVRIQ